jgi:membrane-associated phospholipid phosphatase
VLDDVLTRDLQLLLGVQRRLQTPAAVTTARALGAAGEHALAWLAAGSLGAAVDRRRRAEWVRATGVVVAAHALSVGLKRLARRTRPAHADLRVHSGLFGWATPGRWGMPSSHAASTTAAAIVFGRLLGTRSTLALPPAMGLSRLVVGAHYPSDVLVGTVLGALTALTPLTARTRRSIAA